LTLKKLTLPVIKEICDQEAPSPGVGGESQIKFLRAVTTTTHGLKTLQEPCLVWNAYLFQKLTTHPNFQSRRNCVSEAKTDYPSAYFVVEYPMALYKDVKYCRGIGGGCVRKEAVKVAK